MASAGKKSNAKGTSTKGRKSLPRGVRFVVCINDSGYPVSLARNKIYRVLADKEAAAEGDLRVVDDSGEDYLYPADRFVPIRLPPAAAASLKKS